MRIDLRLKSETVSFVESLLKYAAQHKTKTFQAGTPLFRARINDADKDNAFELADMGVPPKEAAGHGRLNPKGIPYPISCIRQNNSRKRDSTMDRL